ncbi:MAG: hypothetical protein Q4C42_10390 [Clostridia bacterium]|nr:hypothetical protein [Clostridia bacterium]
MFLQKLQQFMYGRYGGDKLNYVLLIGGLLISFIGRLTGLYIIVLISYVLYFYAIFRMLSRNHAARYKEYCAFLRVWNPLTKWFRLQKKIFAERKTYKYFKCPNCKQQLRAPKGRGKIQVTCQKCRKEFIKKV